MLWMGWFGFNAGSALASGAAPGHTLLCTHIAACTCGIVWMLMSKIEDGKPSIVATLNGAIAGLAGVTPASGFITSQSAFILGIVLGFASYYAVKLFKNKLKIDDALDVSSVHGVTGVVGSLAVGFVAENSRSVAGEAAYGLFLGGGGHLLIYQIIGVVVAAAWSGIWTFVICKILEKTTGFRVTEEEEESGLDASLHGETARVLDVSPEALSPRRQPQGAADPESLDLTGKAEGKAEATEASA
jgi:Amt family ammonium transporter